MNINILPMLVTQAAEQPQKGNWYSITGGCEQLSTKISQVYHQYATACPGQWDSPLPGSGW